MFEIYINFMLVRGDSYSTQYDIKKFKQLSANHENDNYHLYNGMTHPKKRSNLRNQEKKRKFE